ncbi:putative flagellar biogenesis protein [Yersinia enterocolitica subsp. enterocolitica WA-314]|nr:putative flagellar biogenesis protein [Yersinia enterocolitica subsp. enterocolitica WA-314]
MAASKSFVRGDKAIQFVELKNMLITLDDNKSERYLQLE